MCRSLLTQLRETYVLSNVSHVFNVGIKTRYQHLEHTRDDVQHTRATGGQNIPLWLGREWNLRDQS